MGDFSSSPNIRIFQSTRGVHEHVRDIAAKVDLTVRSNSLVLLELQIFRGQFVLCGVNKSKGVRIVWYNSHLFFPKTISLVALLSNMIQLGMLASIHFGVWLSSEQLSFN